MRGDHNDEPCADRRTIEDETMEKTIRTLVDRRVEFLKVEADD